MTAGVSAHLEQQHGVRIPPGGKGTCPFCRHDTFSVRRDDSVGKCFHPRCGKAVTEGHLVPSYGGSLYQVLDKVKEDCHQHLLAQKIPGHGHAWEYVFKERNIHPDVVRDLGELGAVPPGYDVNAAFQPALDAVEARRQELAAKIDESLKRRLAEMQAREAEHQAGRQKARPAAKDKTEAEKQWEQELVKLTGAAGWLQEQREALRERFAEAPNWLAFFHTDRQHRVRSIRFRKPYEKRFQSFNPFRGAKEASSTGLFGHGLFRPYVGAAKQEQNRLVLVEGEFNLLQIHSLALRTADRPPGSNGGGAYANWIGAVGSATTVDVETVRALLATPGAVDLPVVLRDHDDAGAAMVERLAEQFTLELVTPPAPGQDVDEFIRAFGKEYGKAWEALRGLLAARRRVCRPFEALANQIFETRQKRDKEDLRREFEIHAQVAQILLHDLKTRGRFYREHRCGYFFFDDDKKLIALDDNDKELSCLLALYGLNASEKVFEYVAEHLHVESLRNGTPTCVRRFAWFDKKAFALYVFNHASGVYRVTAAGIELLDNGTDGVLFLHDRKNEPYRLLEDQVPAGLVHEAIAAQINFDSDGRVSVVDQQAVFDFWLLSTFFGSLLPTRPLLAFIGPKGSGKSHTLRKVGVLLFGSRFEVKNLPDREDAFDAVTTNSHFAAFDNADSYMRWLPDRLAICATGGTISKRVLFTMNTLADFPIDCFLGITSRTPYFRRDDVADRMLILQVRRFGEGEFVSEGELLSAVLKDRDRIMSAVLRRLQEVIGALEATATRLYKTSFRMADFATFCLRVGDAKGHREEVEALLSRLAEEQVAFTLEGDSLLELLVLWLVVRENQGREIDAGTLHHELVALAKQGKVEFAYKSAKSLSQRLKNAEREFRSVFQVGVTYDRHRKQNVYQFWPQTEAESRAGVNPQNLRYPQRSPQGNLLMLKPLRRLRVSRVSIPAYARARTREAKCK